MASDRPETTAWPRACGWRRGKLRVWRISPFLARRYDATPRVRKEMRRRGKQS